MGTEDGEMWAAFREERKDRRQVKYDVFITHHLPKLRELASITNLEEYERQGKIIIDSTIHGRMFFYPKANSLKFCRNNKWIDYGIQFIIKCIIKAESEGK